MENKMLDFLERELIIGDKVIFVKPGYKYFVKGTVQSISPKQLKVMFFNSIYKQDDFTHKYPSELIKYE